MPLAALGEFAQVRQHLETALAVPFMLPSHIDPAADHDLYALLADAAAQARDAQALQRYAPLAEEAAQRLDHGLYLAIARRARGAAHRLAGEYPEAHARLETALEGFQALGAQWQIGRTLVELARVAEERTQPDVARRYYAEALQAFEVVGAAPDAAQTRAALERAQGNAPARRLDGRDAVSAVQT